MAKERKKLKLSCGASDCGNGMHCFVRSKKNPKKQADGSCLDCGENSIEWDEVRKRDTSGVEKLLDALKTEYIRAQFWNKKLPIRAQAYTLRKGKNSLTDRIQTHLRSKIGAAEPFRDGLQTAMDEDPSTPLEWAQHATATCCRQCLQHWYGIPVGRELTSEELEHLSGIVLKYVEEKIPNLKDEGIRVQKKAYELTEEEFHDKYG